MPRSAKNPLLKKSATQNERDFRVDFYAEDAIRLSPYKDDKWKYAENTPFGRIRIILACLIYYMPFRTAFC